MISTGTSAGQVVVVDDQPANLHVVNILLSRQGYEVFTARNADDALQLCEQQLPDLMLLDLMMPGRDGFALLSDLKQRPALQRMPVVFLTATHDRDFVVRAFDAGAVDYVTKPFMPEELLARVHAHIGLKLTRDRLERVARERQELVNLVAHDLKNPLSSVLFASDLLQGGHYKPERMPRYLSMIRESADEALGYICRYLDGQGSDVLHKQACSHPVSAPLREVVDALVRRYELQLEELGMQLQVHMPACSACVAIETQVLRQVAENLFTNAIKYARCGHELDLTLRNSAPGYWQLVVQDRGPGIGAMQQRELFNPFMRLSESAAADQLSSGLGLSLARQIIATAGGQLWYEDREGGGARFIIELPEAETDIATAVAS